jgi:hypothetical protein
MNRCAKCMRPLKRDPGPDGMGPVCAKNAKPAPSADRDLFGFDVARAETYARTRVKELIDVRANYARYAIRDEFRAARTRLGVI